MDLLIPMSGQGARYREAGYREPKPLVPINGTPMIERVLSCFPVDWRATFVLAANHLDTELPSALRRLRPEARQMVIPAHAKGPSFAIRGALDSMNDDTSVFVSYCDFGMVFDPRHFERFVADTSCDACVVSYRGFHAHYLSPTTYAYSRLEGDRVVEVREKASFTDDREQEFAQAGAFYFRRADVLRDAIDYQLANELTCHGEYYTSLTIEALLRMRPESHVRVFEIPAFFQWGTPADLRAFEYWETSYRAYNRLAARPRPRVSQILMPMAGGGARFSARTRVPKPLIPVHGRPMFAEALRSLPTAGRTVIVTLRAIQAASPELSEQGMNVVALASTPAGQALSVEAGLLEIDDLGDILVSSCDHGIVIDPATIERLTSQSVTCDAAVFTITGYPGVDRSPMAYAYVVPDASDADPFPRIQRVSVKTPISAMPSQAPLLVGTFWFRTRDILSRGLAELKRRNQLVNGELYLDGIADVLASMGCIVRMVPLDGYLGWGDPDALAEALYWRDVFCGFGSQPRERLPGVPGLMQKGPANGR